MLAAHNESCQGTARGAVIFLHGSGDSGPGCEAWVNHVMPEFLPRLRSAGIVVIFPSAPVRAYSLIGGAPLTVWFDRKALALDASEDSKGLAETALQIRQLVQDLKAEHSSLSNQHIVLGGFSMGGATVLTTGLGAWLDDENTPSPGTTNTAAKSTSPPSKQHLPNLAGLAGVFSISSYLSTQSSIWPKLEAARTRHLAARSTPSPSENSPCSSSSSGNNDSNGSITPSSSLRRLPLLPPVFLGHGSADPMIPPAWGADTHTRLVSHQNGNSGGGSSSSSGEEDDGMTMKWVLEPHVRHEPGPKVLAELLEWTLRLLPPR